MEYLSFSRLSLLDTCGLRFYYEYVLQLPGEDPVPTFHASFGTLIHALYEDHANSGGRLSYEELKKVYDTRFPGLVPEFPSREDAVPFYKNGLHALARFSRYRVEKVVASEQLFLLDMGDEVPPVKGFIDRVIHAKPHGYIVADLKTGKVFPGKNPKKMRQLVLYSLACEQIYGEPAHSGYFDFVVHGQREWVDISGENRRAAKDWVRQKWQQITREEFPARYSANFCSKYCPYRSRCPEFGRKSGGQLVTMDAAREIASM